MEDVALLPSRVDNPNTPVIVDLYAPQLLENLYEADDGEVSHQLLHSARADAYLIAHEAQRDHCVFNVWSASKKSMRGHWLYHLDLKLLPICPQKS